MPLPIIPSLEAIRSILEVAEIYDHSRRIKKLFSGPFLNYDPSFLYDVYNKEPRVGQHAPYREEICWIGSHWEETIQNSKRIQVREATRAKEFKIQSEPEYINAFHVEALEEFRRSGRVNANSSVVRLKEWKRTDARDTLIIQKAHYHDQVQSNLVMDWQGSKALRHNGYDSFRAYLNAKYEGRLPPFSTNLLANTIGISTILFFSDSGGRLVPYLPRRSKGILRKSRKLAVSPGGFSDSASGALEWAKNNNSFAELVTKDMYREMEEEVGICESDVEVMLPLALCREFLRGGKPQIFYAGVVMLSEAELMARRREAIGMSKSTKQKIEISDLHLVFDDPHRWKQELTKNPLTLEAIENLQYAERFLAQYLRYKSS
jgi:hypothetical protein